MTAFSSLVVRARPSNSQAGHFRCFSTKARMRSNTCSWDCNTRGRSMTSADKYHASMAWWAWSDGRPVVSTQNSLSFPLSQCVSIALVWCQNEVINSLKQPCRNLFFRPISLICVQKKGTKKKRDCTQICGQLKNGGLAVAIYWSQFFIIWIRQEPGAHLNSQGPTPRFHFTDVSLFVFFSESTIWSDIVTSGDNRFADGTSPLRIQRAAKSLKESLFEAPGNDVPADPVSPPRRSYPGSIGLVSRSRSAWDAPSNKLDAVCRYSFSNMLHMFTNMTEYIMFNILGKTCFL